MALADGTRVLDMVRAEVGTVVIDPKFPLTGSKTWVQFGGADHCTMVDTHHLKPVRNDEKKFVIGQGDLDFLTSLARYGADHSGARHLRHQQIDNLIAHLREVNG